MYFLVLEKKIILSAIILVHEQSLESKESIA